MTYPRWFGLLLVALVLQLSIVDPLWAQSEVSFTRQGFGVGAGPFAVTVGDFNGDSQQDLATANSLSATVSVLLGNECSPPVEGRRLVTRPSARHEAPAWCPAVQRPEQWTHLQGHHP